MAQFEVGDMFFKISSIFDEILKKNLPKNRREVGASDLFSAWKEEDEARVTHAPHTRPIRARVLHAPCAKKIWVCFLADSNPGLAPECPCAYPTGRWPVPRPYSHFIFFYLIKNELNQI